MLYRINDKIVDQLYVYKMKYIYGKLQRLIWYGSKISFQSVFITIWGTFQIELTNKSSCFFNWLYFFKAILSSQKNWGEDTDIPRCTLPPHMHRFCHYQHLPAEWYTCYSWWTCTETSYSPKVHSLQFTLVSI